MIERFGEEEYGLVNLAMKDGKYSEYFRNSRGGPWIQEFERKFAEYHGMPYAIAVSSGTAALHIALQAVLDRSWTSSRLGLGVRELPVVAVSPYTFIASASCVLMANALPFFIDIDPETYTIPPSGDRGSYIPRGTYTIIPVDLLGHPCDYDWLKASNMWDFIVQDACQSLGARYKGALCGTQGNISTFSFQFTKTITTLGEGGMILTRDIDLYERCLALRSHGTQYAGAPYLTYNYRMMEPQAAFGCAQLDKLDSFLSMQKRNAEYICQHLPRGIYPPKVASYADHSFYLIGCRYDEEEASMTREQFIQACTEKGVNKNKPGQIVSTGYLEGLHEKHLFRRHQHPLQIPLPNTKSVMEKSLWLDVHRWKELDEVKADLEVMSKILGD